METFCTWEWGLLSFMFVAVTSKNRSGEVRNGYLCMYPFEMSPPNNGIFSGMMHAVLSLQQPLLVCCSPCPLAVGVEHHQPGRCINHHSFRMRLILAQHVYEILLSPREVLHTVRCSSPLIPFLSCNLHAADYSDPIPW